jgi:hypothetical protein
MRPAPAARQLRQGLEPQPAIARLCRGIRSAKKASRLTFFAYGAKSRQSFASQPPSYKTSHEENYGAKQQRIPVHRYQHHPRVRHNARRTFAGAKLQELVESIRTNGLIQPITVRPNSGGFEVVAGARRFRASQLAEMFSIPARIVEISDAQTLEWQLVENSQRVNVHPYEEPALRQFSA